ncbi:hypothetical protein ACOMHN_046280 [Nucella lapillus]
MARRGGWGGSEVVKRREWGLDGTWDCRLEGWFRDGPADDQWRNKGYRSGKPATTNTRPRPRPAGRQINSCNHARACTCAVTVVLATGAGGGEGGGEEEQTSPWIR